MQNLPCKFFIGDTLLIDREVVGKYEVRFEYVDDIFLRKTYGTYYVIINDIEKSKMRSQQIFQDFYKAKKYYNYFIEMYTNLKAVVVPKHPGPKKELIRNVEEAGRIGRGYSNNLIRKYVSKAPWWYNLTRV